MGIPLHQKQHVGDLWIAASAVRWQLPLVAHDAIFRGCPRLEVRTELRQGIESLTLYAADGGFTVDAA